MMSLWRPALLWLLVLGLLLPLSAQEQAPPPAPPAPPATTDAAGVPPIVPGESPPTPPTLPPEAPPATPVPPRPGIIPITVSALRSLFSPSLGLYQFFGEVVVTTDRLVINASEVTYNDRTRSVLARGIVSIRTEDGITYWGNLLEYSVTTRQWRFVEFTVAYPAGFIGPPFIAPVIINGEELSGIQRGVRAENALVTTCNLAEPHYVLRSRWVEIYPGDKLIARDNDFYVLGNRIIHIPYFFLSLRQTRTPITPEFGRNTEEGYYGRFLYQYVFNPEQLGGVRLDVTQKLGPGLGVNHFYGVPGGSGEAFAYARQGLDEYVVRVDHTQQLPAQINLRFRGDIRENSRFSIQPTTNTIINADITRNTPASSTRLLLNRNLNQGIFSSDSITSNLTYTPRLSKGSLTTNFRYSSFGRSSSIGATPALPADQELWSTLQWIYPLKFASFNLRVDHRTDVEGDDFTLDRFTGTQRLPELSLIANRAGGNLGVLRPFTNSLTLGWGIFSDSTGTDRLDRYRLEWEAPQVRVTRGSTTLSTTSFFKQTVYGDPDVSAQYVLNGNVNATTRFGNWQNVLRYGRREVRGFPFLSFDADYPNESAYDSLQYITPNFSAYLTSGRDLRRNTWSDITFRSNARLTPALTTSQSFAFDPNTDRWRDLISRFSFATTPLILNVGSQYNLEQGHLQRISTELSWQIDSQWSLEWLGGYDSPNRRFLYNEFLVKRDLHCWDIALYVSREQNTAYLYLRLKALNMPLPRLGIGAGGQVLDPGTGAPI